MTTLVVLQPGYLPWLGYFDLMNKADVFIHYDDVQFDKHGWRNRNRVKGPNGTVWLTVPVLHSGRFGQSLIDVEIDNRQDWRRKHLLTLRQSYARASFVHTILLRLQEILQRPWLRLVDVDLAIIEWLATELGISPQFHRSSLLNVGGDRNHRLINFCRYFGASRYISGNAAREYIDLRLFTAAGIELIWHDYSHPTYPQQHNGFIPYLSVLDLLLNVGINSLEVLSRSSRMETDQWRCRTSR